MLLTFTDLLVNVVVHLLEMTQTAFGAVRCFGGIFHFPIIPETYNMPTTKV